MRPTSTSSSTPARDIASGRSPYGPREPSSPFPHRSCGNRSGAGRSRRCRRDHRGSEQAARRIAQAGPCAGRHQGPGSRRRSRHTRSRGDVRRRARPARAEWGRCAFPAPRRSTPSGCNGGALQGRRRLLPDQARGPARQTHLAGHVQRRADQACYRTRCERRTAGRCGIDRPPAALDRLGASYETQLGFGIEGFWVHRNLFGQAESLRLSGEINHIGQVTRSSTRALRSGPPSASPTGGCQDRTCDWKRPRCAKWFLPIRGRPRPSMRLRPHLLAPLAGPRRLRDRDRRHHPQRRHPELSHARPAGHGALQSRQQRPRPDARVSPRIHVQPWIDTGPAATCSPSCG